MSKTIKVRTRPGGPITEQPAEQARQLIKEGLWFAASDEKAASQTEHAIAPQPKRRKPR